MSLTVDIEKKLKNITLRIAFETKNDDGITGILGASGCGKSMTLKCIAGIVTPDAGKIILNDRVLFDSERNINLKVQERRAGYLFQNYALFPNMTVRQNIEIALGKRSREGAETAQRFMELLHVSDLAENYPDKLSGGQQQRVALARILASNPDVLMLDEPFSALDYFLKESIELELLDILKEYRGDILMVTHNRDEIYRFCSHIHVLEKGKCVASGETKEVFKNPGMTAAAKLTGCKNIAKVKRLSDYELEVPAWNTILKFQNKIPENISNIGVRAHNIRKKTEGDTFNILRCRCRKVLRDPFEVTLILEEGIWWKISNENWDKLFNRQVPDEFVIPEDSVLFLCD